ncbi:hypothetical protein WQ57_09950 [Mesobacillus campisalis]|uniref:Uncharacterized protein n=1 Tax=Mesobacillus campisalis TaxID=1408103 RepID=A0A0M2SWN9_9BACI|nr:hypothetical protein WQ57_09950 [Mesobacillus campisalis]
MSNHFGGYYCKGCGGFHEDLPLSYGSSVFERNVIVSNRAYKVVNAPLDYKFIQELKDHMTYE